MRARQGRVVSGIALLAVLLLGAGCDDASSTDDEPPVDPEVVESGALVVCADLPYAPFVLEEDGEPTGFELDLLGELASRLDLDLELRRTAYADLDDGTALADDECDVAAGALAVTEEREARMVFTRPHYDEKVTLLVPAASDVDGFDDMAGRRLAVQDGTAAETYAEQNAPSSTEIILMPGGQRMVEALRAGDVDAVLQELSLNQVHARDGAFEVVDERSTGTQYAFAVGRDAPELREDLDRVLAALRSDGTLDTVTEEYFPVE